jgi:hypothetical protein
MKSRELSFLMQNISQIINLLRTVNINHDAVLTHAATSKLALAKLDKLKAQYQDEELMKTLSPAEQQAILKNAQNAYGVFEELRKELEYLDLSKQPTFLASASNELEKAYLLIEYLLEFMGKTGETILPKLAVMNPKTFEGGKYKNQIDSLYAEVEAQAHDFYVDHVQGEVVIQNPLKVMKGFINTPMLIPISGHLTLAACWLGKEKLRLTTEALPEIKVIKLPEDVLPEVPKAPEEVVTGEAKMEVVSKDKTE